MGFRVIILSHYNWYSGVGFRVVFNPVTTGAYNPSLTIFGDLESFSLGLGFNHPEPPRKSTFLPGR